MTSGDKDRLKSFFVGLGVGLLIGLFMYPPLTRYGMAHMLLVDGHANVSDDYRIVGHVEKRVPAEELKKQ